MLRFCKYQGEGVIAHDGYWHASVKRKNKLGAFADESFVKKHFLSDFLLLD